MYKIAVIGDRESIYGYAALGLETFAVEHGEDAAKSLRRLAENEYAVIYITESLASQLHGEIERYKDSLVPAVITIPGIKGNTGQGMAMVKRSVERAVGSDIIFNNE